MSFPVTSVHLALRHLQEGWSGATAAVRVRLICRLRRVISVEPCFPCARLVFPILSQLLASWEEGTVSLQEGCSEDLSLQIFALVVDACSGRFDDLIDGRDDAACNQRILLQLVSAEKLQSLNKHEQQTGGTIGFEFSSLFLSENEKTLYNGDKDLRSDKNGSSTCRSKSFREVMVNKRVQIVRSSLKEPNIQIEGSIAHILQICREAVTAERAVDVRIAALLAMRVIILVIPPDLAAAFLPGLSATLTTFLCRCRLEHSRIAITAMDALCHILVRTIPRSANVLSFLGSAERISRLDATAANLDPENMQDASNPQFSEILSTMTSSSEKSGIGIRPDGTSESKADPMPLGANDFSGRPTLRIQQNTLWTEKASTEVSRCIDDIIQSKDGPSYHAKPWVRQMLARFCGQLLGAGLKIVASATDTLLACLVALRSDDFVDVGSLARMELDELVKIGIVDLSQLRSGVDRTMTIALSRSEAVEIIAAVNNPGTSAKRAISSFDPDKDQTWIRQFHGYFETIEACAFHLSKRRILQDEDIAFPSFPCQDDPETVVLHVVSYFDVERFIRVLIRLFEVSGEPSSSPLLVASATSRESRAVNTCKILGRCGSLSLLHAPLLAIAEKPRDETNTSDFIRLHCLNKRNVLAVSEALVIGALDVSNGQRGRKMQTDEKMARFSSHRRGQGAHCALELLGALAAFKLEDFTASQIPSCLIDEKLLHAKVATLQSIENVFAALVRNGKCLEPDYLLAVIIGLLQDAAVDHDDVRGAAFKVMDLVATKYNAADWRELLDQHLNYVVSRVLSSLGHRWTGPVLRLIIGYAKDNVCRRATALVESTLASCCDELAGASNYRVIGTLAAIRGVLEANMRHSNVTPIEEMNGTQPDTQNIAKTPQEETDLAKCLLNYCTDDIESKLWTNTDPETDENCFREPSKHRGPTGVDCELNEDADVNERHPFGRMASSALAGCCDLLVGRPLEVRVAALRCATCAVVLLADDTTTLLPHIATLLPLIPEQFIVSQSRKSIVHLKSQLRRGLSTKLARACLIIDLVNEYSSNLQVISAASDLLSSMVQYASTFVRGRFIRLIFPSIEPLLELLSVHPTIELEASKPVYANISIPSPSYAAMNAADSALGAVSYVAQVLPSALEPFASKLIHYLLPYLSGDGASIQRHAATVRRRVGSSAVRERYERERFELRCRHAHNIMTGLTKVAPDIVWYRLVQVDESCPAELSKPHPELQDILVRIPL